MQVEGGYERLSSQGPAYFAGVWVQGGLKYNVIKIEYDPVSTYLVGVWVGISLKYKIKI